MKYLLILSKKSALEKEIIYLAKNIKNQDSTKFTGIISDYPFPDVSLSGIKLFEISKNKYLRRLSLFLMLLKHRPSFILGSNESLTLEVVMIARIINKLFKADIKFSIYFTNFYFSADKKLATFTNNKFSRHIRKDQDQLYIPIPDNQTYFKESTGKLQYKITILCDKTDKLLEDLITTLPELLIKNNINAKVDKTLSPETSIIISRADNKSLYKIYSGAFPAIIIPDSQKKDNNQLIEAFYLSVNDLALFTLEKLSVSKQNLLTFSINHIELINKISYLIVKNNSQRIHNNLANINKLSYQFWNNLFKEKEPFSTLETVNRVTIEKILEIFNIPSFIKNKTDIKLPPFIKNNKNIKDIFENIAYKLIISDSWEKKNLGIKILGLLPTQENLTILNFLFCEKQSSFQKKIIGRASKVDFINRNIINSYQEFITLSSNEIIIKNCLIALQDTYYETVIAALDLIIKNPKLFLDYDTIKKEIINIMKNKKDIFILEKAILASEILITNESLFKEKLQKFFYHNSTLIRAAVIKITKNLLDNNIIDIQFATKITNEMFLISSASIAEFKLKKLLKEIKKE